MKDEHKPGTGILKMLPNKEPETPTPCAPLVAMLEEMLSRAKTGEISSAVIMAKTGTMYNYDFAGIECISHMIGYNTICDLVKGHFLAVISDNAD